MAITFIEKRKRQKYLILGFIIIILGTLIVLWQGFWKKEKPTPPIAGPPREIKINFEVLESPILKELQPFEEIPSFEEKVGRENPFLSY